MRLVISLILLLSTLGATAQSIIGSWEGVLKTNVIDLPLIFHFGEQKGVLLATLDSPEQNSYDIPADSVSFADSTVVFKYSPLRMVYEGKMISKDSIKGVFTQGARSKELWLVKAKNKSTSTFLKGFEEEELEIKNKKANVILSATLTYPKDGKDLPAVILISGSGPQDRNSALFGKRPFKNIAEHFTRSGYAVLRFDDRGVAKSTGSFSGATSFDFAQDVEAIFNYLKKKKQIDNAKIGLLGHSEGSLIASIVASKNSEVAFILSLGGPGTRGDSLILSQAKLIMQGAKIPDSSINTNLEMNRAIYREVLGNNDSLTKDKEVKKIVFERSKRDKNYDSAQTAKLANTLAAQANTDWFINFLSYDPSLYWTKVKCPVFAINGVKDMQVPAVENIMGIQKHLSAGLNYDVTIKMYPNLNHLFQNCETGMPSEYASIKETISGLVLNDLVTWLNRNIKSK